MLPKMGIPTILFIIIFNLANAGLLFIEKWCNGKDVIVIMCVYQHLCV